MTKQIEIPVQLYNELQQLKEVFSSLTGKPITEDSDIIDILVWTFVDSLNNMHNKHWGCGDDCGCSDEEGKWECWKDCDCKEWECKNSKDWEGCCGGNCGC